MKFSHTLPVGDQIEVFETRYRDSSPFNAIGSPIQ
jgi:hypothetical protein